jgi:hypothetical protein
VERSGEDHRDGQAVGGPLVRVPEGTVIEASIKNTLADSTLVLYGFETRPGSPHFNATAVDPETITLGNEDG